MSTVDRAAGLIWNFAEEHRETWQDKGKWHWYFGLVEEVLELGLALLGIHKHNRWERPDETVQHKLAQVGSIAINWLRRSVNDANTKTD